MHAFSFWQVLVLALVQGLAEFLPISSSGHLVVLAPLLFGQSDAPPDMLLLSVLLHVGTLGSILVYYRRRIVRLASEDRRVLGLLLIGTLPAAVAGVVIKVFAQQVVENSLLAGLMLPVTGGILLWMSRRPPGRGEYRDLRWRSALWIGLCQAAAILPGLSRSGLTIAAGVSTGLSGTSAATYSFLLAIPAIAGAGLIESLAAFQHSPKTPWALLVAGVGVSFVVGLVGLWWLETWLARGRLQWFAWYCIALGGLVLAWQLAAT